jgi:hypothetical protein
MKESMESHNETPLDGWGGTIARSIQLSARWTWPGLRPGGEAAHRSTPFYIIVLVWFYVTPDRGTTASVARRGTDIVRS